MKDLIRGASAVPRAFTQLLQPGIRRYVVLPITVNALVFAGLFWLGVDQFAVLLNAWLPDPTQYASSGWFDSTMRWLLTLLYWLLWPVFVLAVAILMFYTFTIVANLIGSPFNGMLSARVERRLTAGREPPDLEGQGLAQEVVGSVMAELRKIGYFLWLALPLALLSAVLFFVPVVNVVVPFLWAIYGAWVISLEYLDYPMANHGYGFKQERSLLRQRRMLAFGFGFAILAMTLVPGLNLLAMPTGVIAATYLWREQVAGQAAASDVSVEA